MIRTNITKFSLKNLDQSKNDVSMTQYVILVSPVVIFFSIGPPQVKNDVLIREFVGKFEKFLISDI